MNTAEYIVKKLEELGVNDFFGVPGDYNFNLIYAVENNPETRWIGCTNELNSGYAADGYARIRGYGALITTYGVGELSAMNAIAGSFAECIPVVHIVGIPATEYIKNNTLLHHNFSIPDYQAYSEAYKSVTAATTVLNKDNAKLEIDRVFKTLIKERKPVYIAIPDDIAIMEISDRTVSYEWLSDKDKLDQAAQKIAEKINNSKRPVIIGDILIKRFDAEIEYKDFVEKTGIPVSNFLMGINLIDMDYPKYLGGYFGDLRNPIAQKYINETDCLICVGTIYSDINSFGFKLPYIPNEQIAIYGTYTYIDGKRYDNIKMAELLDAVAILIEEKNIEIDKPNISLKNISGANEQLDCSYIFPKIQDFIKENDIILADTGIVPHGIAQMKIPSSVIVEQQLLWASIGWATPATLGVCTAKPQTRVILLTGDGAHLMSALEIGTMIRFGIKPIIILINNKGYTIERLLSGKPNENFNNIVQMNFSKFARAFEGDIWSTKALTPEDFDKALKVTQIMNKMCYIEVCTNPMDSPKLIKDFLNYSDKIDTDNQEQQIENFDNDLTEDLMLTAPASNLKYETVVHKGFKLKEPAVEENEVEEK